MTFRLGYYEPGELGDDRAPLGGDPRRRDRGRGGRRDRAAARAARRGSRTGSCAAIRDVAEVRHAGAVTIDVAREALELLEVDEAGLERIDRELLSAIAHKFGGGPVGLSTLAVALGEEPDTIEDVYEPYLLQLGFLQRTPRGRVITELGRAHIGAGARQTEPVLSRCRRTSGHPGMAGPLDEFVEPAHADGRGVPRRSTSSSRRRCASSSSTARVTRSRRRPPSPASGSSRSRRTARTATSRRS